MRDTTTFIKLDRNIVDWRWLGDPNTLAVWIYLLVTAKNEPEDFRDFTIGRGEVICCVEQIAAKLGMSDKNVRTALEHLTKTGEIRKIRRSQKFVIYLIEGFSRYQAKPAISRQSGGDLSAISRQSSGEQVATYKEGKEGKEEKKYKKYKNGERAPARARPTSGGIDWDLLRARVAAEEAAENHDEEPNS